MDLRPVTRQFLTEEGVYQAYENVVRPPVKASRRDMSNTHTVDFSTVYTWNSAKKDVYHIIPQFTYYKVWDAKVRQPGDVTRDRNTLGKKFDRQRQMIISDMTDKVSRIFKRGVNEARGIVGDIQENAVAYSAEDDMFDFAGPSPIKERGRSPVKKSPDTRRRITSRSRSKSSSKTRKLSGSKLSGSNLSGSKKSKSPGSSNGAKTPEKPFVAPQFDVFWD